MNRKLSLDSDSLETEPKSWSYDFEDNIPDDENNNDHCDRTEYYTCLDLPSYSDDIWQTSYMLAVDPHNSSSAPVGLGPADLWVMQTEL